MMSTDELNTAMTEGAERIERILDRALAHEALPGEMARPVRLVDAMRHGSLGGGKRLRPFLLIESAVLCGAARDDGATAEVAAALELIHCYSLVHDDLPAMDDDDLRRGRPTVHVAFDEATAILAGDTLMTVAFDLIASAPGSLSAERKVALITLLSRASGVGGMAGGQMLDLLAETEPPDEAGIVRLQAMKTGALIRFACEGGAIAAGATDEVRRRVVRYGEAVGLAFQVADDLLDLTQTAEAMGKATGKDAGQGKGTLVALHGEAWARRKVSELIDEADTAMEPFGERAAMLRALARFVAQRDH